MAHPSDNQRMRTTPIRFVEQRRSQRHGLVLCRPMRNRTSFTTQVGPGRVGRKLFPICVKGLANRVRQIRVGGKLFQVQVTTLGLVRDSTNGVRTDPCKAIGPRSKFAGPSSHLLHAITHLDAVSQSTCLHRTLANGCGQMLSLPMSCHGSRSRICEPRLNAAPERGS